VRYALQLIVMAIIIKWKKFSLLGIKEHRKLLTLRGFFGFLGLMSLYFSVKLINPSDSTALSNTKLIILAVLARIFLKERFTTIHIFSLCLTIAGIVLISQPSFLIKPFSTMLNNEIHNNTGESHRANKNNNLGLSVSMQSYLGISLALFSAFAGSVVSILIKKLTNIKAHFSILIIYAAYIGLPTSLAITLVLRLTGAQKSNRNFNDMYNLSMQIFYSISSASCGILGQILLTNSFKHENVTKIAVLRSTNLFWAFLLQYIFLDIEANIFSLSGVILIFSAILFTIIAKAVEKRLQQNHQAKEIVKYTFIEKFLFFDF
jgi:drug/metabolite transporter (DMT)-like permease